MGSPSPISSRTCWRSSAGEGSPRPAVTATVALVTLANEGRPAILLLMAADRTALAATATGSALFRVAHDERIRRPVAHRTSRPARALSAPAVDDRRAGDALTKIATLDTLDEVVEIDPAWRVTSALAWGYLPVADSRRPGEAADRARGGRHADARRVGDHRATALPGLQSRGADAAAWRVHVEHVPRGEL